MSPEAIALISFVYNNNEGFDAFSPSFQKQKKSRDAPSSGIT
jgi:hypothetical protein